MNTNYDACRKPVGPSAVSDSRLNPPSNAISKRASKQLLVACLFWMLCLTLTAAGHRLYKTVVAVDRQMSAKTYQADGAAIVWVGHGTIDDAAARFPKTNGKDVGANIHALPNSVFWLTAMSTFTILAVLLAWSGQFVKHNGTQSLIGLFAGHFLWLGAVEFGLDAVGRRLGLCGALTVVDDRIVGTHGAGVLIQMSVVFLAAILIGLTMHESNRCAMFQWFRNRLPLTRAPSATGRVDNYAARTTMQYFVTVWFCYVAVLWLADPMLGPVGGVCLLVAMTAIFVATPYMIWRTTKQSGIGQSLRYSISGAIITWTGIEIAASMRMFEEPWLSNSAFSGLLFLILSVVLTATSLSIFVHRAKSPILSRSLAGAIVAMAFLGMGGCGVSNEGEFATSPDEIEARLREYNDRIEAPNETAIDGLLYALTSDSLEMAAQAAVSFGKARSVGPVVRQQLESMAISDRSRLRQFSALQALLRLNLLTRETQAIIDELSEDETWEGVIEYITQ